jgi:hypothetical protein
MPSNLAVTYLIPPRFIILDVVISLKLAVDVATYALISPLITLEFFYWGTYLV